MFRLVKVLSDTMGKSFPELKDQRQLIENVVKEEEYSFLKTLDQGLLLLDNIVTENKDKEIDGRKAFELYDTFGFPIDLTALILSERGYELDEKGFHTAMQEQKDRSRSASEVSKEDWIVLIEDPQQEFVGYDNLETSVKIVKYRKVTSKKEGEQYQIVFNLTPFYPEGGGQVGDKGYLEAPNGDVVYILDTKKENNEIVHFAKNLPRDTGDKFKAVVDAKQRRRTECNHTATHLLHQALREILGTHVEQKGSAVHSKYLRFDFSHFAKLGSDELREVESFVNARISNGLPLEEQRNVPMEKAMEQGAMALFGEKYGDAVRTIRFGQSIELCGGTHVRNTADIWHFKIRSEGAVAAGIRRIEAITSDAVKDFYTESNNTLMEIKELLNNSQEPVKTLTALQEENLKLKKELEKLLKDKAKNLKGELLGGLTEVNGIQFLAKKVDLDAAGIKDISFELGQNRKDLFLLFAAENEGKAILSCYISKELAQERNLNAGTIVRELGKYIQGGGGGQPFFATAGGKNPAGIPEALEKAKSYL
jgi:alanyl-tRNA synthetase